MYIHHLSNMYINIELVVVQSPIVDRFMGLIRSILNNVLSASEKILEYRRTMTIYEIFADKFIHNTKHKEL